MTYTETGKQCLIWSDIPNSASLPYFMFSHLSYEDRQEPPEDLKKNLYRWVSEQSLNYCRNPGMQERPWCFVSYKDFSWEYCNIPFCDSPKEPVECRLTRMGMEYAGLKNVDADGRKCQRWLSQTPHKHSMLLHLLEFPDSGLDSHHNYCRNPGDRGMSGPWCYPEGSNEKKSCGIPFCWEAYRQVAIAGKPAKGYPECLQSAKGEEYVGTTRKTETGKECYLWDSKPYGKTDDFDPSESYEDHFPDNHDKTTTAAENFCRNPTSKERPWCFVADADKKWEYCNISICPDYPSCLNSPGHALSRLETFHFLNDAPYPVVCNLHAHNP
ncbi:unnamed protein product [Darwinula stevensoni]|uniref:Kringle domain-containing protein n=1 Tax=Darwinula stevensoni TaxID=69355 RepID=A0A7R8XF13_9CRUS|nr:unnamed protein product [Darwinula stevensoni]CAG0895829.1 unnamed protein product [Darwinula stevensoni]